MALPFDELSTLVWSATFRSPRDKVVAKLARWERGGVAINDPTQGLDIYDWYFRCDSATGAVYASVPGVIAESLIYTIAPLPVEMAASFDTNMQPMVAWRDVNGDAFLWWYDTSPNEYVVYALPARVHSLHLALDDVRDPVPIMGVTDTILAYVKNNVVYYRQLRDRFLTEYTVGGGFPRLYQIGMNANTRFQFARSRPGPDGAAALSYLQPDNRADLLVGFDEYGDAALHEPAPGIVGPTGPASEVDKLVVSNGQTVFLRGADGAWDNTTVTVTIYFYVDHVEMRARRDLTFSIDAEGNITRVTDLADGEDVVTINEVGVGTPTYTATVSLASNGYGVTFNLVAGFGAPAFGEFTPRWNDNADFFGGGLIPTGSIHYADYGPFVVLNATGTGHTGRSVTTRLRWGAGSIPEKLRPPVTRVYACTVTRDGVTVAGQAQFNTDGSAEFWPLVESSTLLVRGEFLRSGPEPRTKGLPVDWQLTYTPSDATLFAPHPELTSLAPDPVDRFTTGLTLTLTGTGFTVDSVASVNTVDQVTTFNSDTELEIGIADALLVATGTIAIRVATPEPGGGTSGIVQLDVVNPSPTLTSITPTSVARFTTGLTLALAGTGFVPEAVGKLDGVAGTTVVNSLIAIDLTVPDADLTTAGTIDVTVTTPTPGGGTTSAQTLTVTNPAPTISSLSPTNIDEDSAEFSLVITGTGYVPDSAAEFGGTPVSVVVDSPTQITATIPAALITTPGSYDVTVINATPGGGTSTPVAFTVNATGAPTDTYYANVVLLLAGPDDAGVGTDSSFASVILLIDGSD